MGEIELLDIYTVYLCYTELFEIELFICIDMNLALNNLQWLICHKNIPYPSPNPVHPIMP